MSWKLIDPLNNQFEGEISELTLAEAKLIKGRWFKWAKYMQLPEKQHVQVFKLTRVGYPDILGIIAVYYEDGVVVDSLEIEPQSRRMPSQQRRSSTSAMSCLHSQHIGDYPSLETLLSDLSLSQVLPPIMSKSMTLGI